MDFVSGAKEAKPNQKEDRFASWLAKKERSFSEFEVLSRKKKDHLQKAHPNSRRKLKLNCHPLFANRLANRPFWFGVPERLLIIGLWCMHWILQVGLLAHKDYVCWIVGSQRWRCWSLHSISAYHYQRGSDVLAAIGPEMMDCPSVAAQFCGLKSWVSQIAVVDGHCRLNLRRIFFTAIRRSLWFVVTHKVTPARSQSPRSLQHLRAKHEDAQLRGTTAAECFYQSPKDLYICPAKGGQREFQLCAHPIMCCRKSQVLIWTTLPVASHPEAL